MQTTCSVLIHFIHFVHVLISCLRHMSERQIVGIADTICSKKAQK